MGNKIELKMNILKPAEREERPAPPWGLITAARSARTLQSEAAKESGTKCGISRKKAIEWAIRGSIRSKDASESAKTGSISSKEAAESAIRGSISSKKAAGSAISAIMGSKKGLESAIEGGMSSRNEARGGCIGNLRRHEASKSAKHSKTQGK